MKILVVEDNKILRENLCFLLKKFNYLGEGAANGQEALDKVSMSNYDAIVLDVNMPIMNGKNFLISLRKIGKIIPVIALTSNSMLEDKLEMFDLGVDDYLTKPFEIEELIARLKSVLKRGEKKIDDKKTIGNVEINFSSKKVYRIIHPGIPSFNTKGRRLQKEVVELPHKQYMIVEYLSKNIAYPKNKTKIMEYVWGESEENLEFNSTTLESHIYSIRKKLGKHFIKTVKGVGYVIE